jgi:hypothetical protein
MTLLFEGSIPRFHEGSVELQIPVRLRSGQALRYAPPDFLPRCTRQGRMNCYNATKSNRKSG